MGLLNNAIPFALFVWGQHYIASGLAAILNATTPLFTVLVAHFLTHDEKLSAGKIAGVALGLLGVILMLGAELLAGLGTGLVAQLACLAAALSYAYVLYFRILAAAGATNLLLVTFLIPISAILLGGLFLGESLATKHFIGMGMIGIGLALIDGRIARLIQSRRDRTS
jgi:drug/metabolite transporter (DMT)-like permease